MSNQGNGNIANRRRPGDTSAVCHVERSWQPSEVFHGKVLLSDGLDCQLAISEVPDTACRRPVVGRDTLAMVESQMNMQAAKFLRARVANQFCFENNGIVQAKNSSPKRCCLMDLNCDVV